MSRMRESVQTASRIVFHTNSAWTLYYFRMNLMQAARARGFEVAACGPRDAFAAKIEQCGIQYSEIPVTLGGINPLVEAAVVLRLFQLYRRLKPSLVHHFGLKASLYGSMAALLAGAPATVNTLTGLGYVFGGKVTPLRRLITFLWRIVCRPRTWTSFQNPDDLQLFRQLNLVRPERAVLISGSGVDPRLFAPNNGAEPPEVPGRTLTFLMFSRMMWDKGVREYVEAAELVTRKSRAGRNRPPPRFVLLGGARPNNTTGVMTEWLDSPGAIPPEWLEEQARAGFVDWHPHDDATLPYIQDADVVVLPSYYREGIPRCLLEAMSCGKAIITTDSPGCRETVVENKNGLLVPPRDAARLADAMSYMLENPRATSEMGAASRRLVLERFSDDTVIRETFDLYERAGLNLSRAAEREKFGFESNVSA